MSATVLPLPVESTTTGMPPVEQTTESVEEEHPSTAATPAHEETTNATETVLEPVTEETTAANGQQDVSTVPPSPAMNTTAGMLPSTTPETGMYRQ